MRLSVWTTSLRTLLGYYNCIVCSVAHFRNRQPLLPRIMSSLTFATPLSQTVYLSSPCATSSRKLLTTPSFRRPRFSSPGGLAAARNDFISQRRRITARNSDNPNTTDLNSRNSVTAKDLDNSGNNGVSDDPTGVSSPEKPLSTTESPNAASSNSLHSSAVEEDEETQEKQSASISVNIFGTPLSIPSRWLLFSVPFMWGSFGPAVRLLFSHEPHLDTAVFNTTRLFLSCMIYSPILLTEFRAFQDHSKSGKPNAPAAVDDEDKFGFIKGGVELGIYVFLANVAQVLGLESVSASRAAFLVQLQTVIVPVLSGILGLEVVGKKTLVASVIAVAGVALLSLDKGHGIASSLTGDGLELLSAFFFSAYIIRLAKYCNRVRSGPLVATKIVMQALLSTVWTLGAAVMSHPNSAVASGNEIVLPEWTLPVIALNFGVIAWTGLVSSALAGWAQTNGQKGVPASDAVVIFATQPLWASALAVILLGESFGPRGFAGGGLIVASTLVAGLQSSLDDAGEGSSSE